VLLYILVLKNRRILSILLFTIGSLIFITEPLYRKLTLEHVPVFLSNYISQQNGSVFTMLPWFGFMAYGAFIATLFYKYADKSKFKLITISLFVGSGLFLTFFSTWMLEFLYAISKIDLFYACSTYNYLFLRLGNVLIAFGLFYFFERFLKHSLITKIGAKTLALYVVHFIILYGSFTGFGLNRFYIDSLTPWQAIFGALLFMIGSCVIVLNLGRMKALLLFGIESLTRLAKR